MTPDDVQDAGTVAEAEARIRSAAARFAPAHQAYLAAIARNGDDDVFVVSRLDLRARALMRLREESERLAQNTSDVPDSTALEREKALYEFLCTRTDPEMDDLDVSLAPLRRGLLGSRGSLAEENGVDRLLQRLFGH